MIIFLYGFRLNVLVVGLNEGKIQLYAYGIAAIGEVDMSQVSQQSHSTKGGMVVFCLKYSLVGVALITNLLYLGGGYGFCIRIFSSWRGFNSKVTLLDGLFWCFV